MLKYLFSISLILSVLIVNSQDITVNAKVDTNYITIGDQFSLTLELKKPLNQNVSFPNLQDTIVNEIEIVDTKAVDTILSNNNFITLQKTYTLTSFDSGAYVIQPFAFVVDSLDTIYTPKTIFIKVSTIPIDTTKQAIADIKKPFEAPITFREFIQEYWPYITIVLFLILAIVLLIIYRDKLKPKKLEKPKIIKPKELGYVIALQELEKLKEKKLWQNNKVKDYYIELTEILRTYLFNQFDIYSLEMTTAETIDEVCKVKIIDEELRKRILQVLSLADFVKFAKANPLPNEHDLSFKNAYSFVEETKKIILNIENNQVTKEENEIIEKNNETTTL